MHTGLIGMRVSSKRLIAIPPHLGYGEKGVADRVPPNAHLLFEVQLLRVSNFEMHSLFYTPLYKLLCVMSLIANCQ